MAAQRFWNWINGLTAKPALAGTEELYINDGGVSKKTTPADIVDSQIGKGICLTGDNTVWDDLDFAMTIRTTDGEAPTLVNLNSTGIYAYAFGDGKAAHFQRQIPHAYKTNQLSWKPHVHWMPTTSATYTGTFTLDFVTHITSTTPSAAPLSVKATRTGSFNVAATAWQGHLTPLDVGGVINGIDWGISTIIFCKLTIALSSGTSIILSGMDWHGEIDSLGSREEYAKQ